MIQYSHQKWWIKLAAQLSYPKWCTKKIRCLSIDDNDEDENDNVDDDVDDDVDEDER